MHLEKRVAGAFEVGAVMFSNVYGTIGKTWQAEEILRQWEKEIHSPLQVYSKGSSMCLFHIAKARHELAQKMMKGYDSLNGKSIRDRLGELSDYVPTEIKRELSQNFSDTRLKVGG